MQNIVGSVGLYGKNLSQDTRTVQTLINKFFGELTLPPLVVDGIVGSKTIGAIRAFQQKRFNKADGRVDPNGPTIKALNQSAKNNRSKVVGCGAKEFGTGDINCDAMIGTSNSFKANGFKLVGSNTILSESASPKDHALAQKKEATLWLTKSLMAIQTVRSILQSGIGANSQTLANMMEYKALVTHFHVDRHSDPVKFLNALEKNYLLMGITLAWADNIFDNEFDSNDFANADSGGFHYRFNSLHPGRIRFCPKYKSLGPLMKVGTIIHEAAHYIDKDIDHYASGMPAPDGRPLEGSNGEVHFRNYSQLLPGEAILNAASYGGFALHIFKGQDTRIGKDQ